MKSQPAPQPRPAVAALPAYVAGRRAQTPLTEPLAANESHFLPLPTVLSAIAGAAVRVNRYPDMASTSLRARVATEFEVDPAEIAVGPGSVGVLAQLISALCDPEDEVVFAWRSFEAYPILCQIAGANAVKVPLTATEHHDLAAMAAAITDRTRVVLLCSPNNPTGTAISTAELESFLADVPPRVLVVLDEAYREYAADGGLDSVALYRKYPNLCLLRTFSKAYGLAGLRVGYAIAREPIAEGLRRTQIPFSVSGVAEAAAIAALGATAEVRDRAAMVVAERERVIAAVREHGWTVPDGAANFIWLRTDDDQRARLVEAFDAAEILVRGYPGDGVRITIAAREANDRVLAVLADQALVAASADSTQAQE
ncbi:histidinol-phosphate transaminase [Propionicimonas sp.]|uniref:histidinol-phosphate transaminase n=1 Tax=Propionicimonas sp. TaxID=1955623 RepID=UPI0018278946|nr:histidinol-phosphate transaminase [Propionicimonas sp.]MBU3977213.1 histidinol-phosphate transaminase [Actinomycetota bacterium]MBA3021139.1 histidinol-phosphate transaminase [Propionicimonas sp.]MBU3985723.1 histidinol-phosphate transaminase [Actinomycetota bacterium]MBU4008508.1 histidinol-phosphate transaminase [Actinomycetota bacterium]MBU4066342.1 histidinol-phosphate transaminase [Actinomycetota bacterium]